jgi:PAS domain S-box-containing protein
MSTDKKNPLGLAHELSLLRKKADKLVRPISAEEAGNMSEQDVFHLIQELQTHQVELEMQNHQLQLATQELAAAQEKYRDLYLHAPFGYVTLDEHGVVEEVNAKGVQILHTAYENLLNRRFSQSVHSNSLDAFYGFFKKVLQTERTQTVELQLSTPTGIELHAQLEGILLKQNNGSQQVRIAFLDVTERKQNHVALHNKEALLSAIINSSLNAIQVFRAVRSPEGEILDFEWLLANKTAEVFLNRPQDQLRRARLAETFPRVVEDGHFTIFQQVVETGHPATFSAHYSLENREIYLNCVAVKLEDGFVFTFEDVSQHRVATEKLQESQLLIKKMAEAMPDFLYVEDLQLGRNVYNNRNFLSFLGYKDTDIQGHPRELLDTLFHPEDASLILNRAHRFANVKDGDFLEYNVRVQAKDSSWRNIHFRETVFKRGASGVPTQLVGIAQDVTEKLKAEQELHRKNETIEAILKNLPVILWRISPQMEILEARGNGLKALGLAQQELEGKLFQEINPDVLKHLQAGFRQQKVQFINKTDVNGQPVYKQNFFFHEEASHELIGFCLDVTEQKKAEEEARHSTMLLDQILQNIPMVLAVLDLQGNYLEIKGKGLQSVGLQANELKGKNIFHVFPFLQGNIQEVLQGQVKSFTASFPYQGRQVFFQNFGFLDTQRQLGIAFGIDITEQKKNQEQLTQEKELSQNLLDTHINGIVALDVDLRIRSWNKKMEEITSLARQQVLGKLLAEVLPQKSQKRLIQKLNRVLLGEQITLYKLPFLAQDRSYEITFTPVMTASQEVSGILAIVHDVTDQQQRQKTDTQVKLDQQKAILEAVLSTQTEERRRIAEALHNSLAQLLYAAKLNLEDVQEQATLDPGAQAPLKRISGFLEEAIRETRTLAHELIPRVLADLGLKAAIKDLEGKLTTPTFTVQSIITGFDKPTNHSIETHLFRFVQELLNNVMKHANASEALVQVVDKGHQFMVRVEDNGQGMPPLEKINSKGMGLRSIQNGVKLLNGQLKIQSGPQEGTVVTIILKK